MPVEILTVPCLDDNYAYLIHDKDSGQTALVDAPDGAPIAAALQSNGWTLTDILITHHHGDHIDGVDALRRTYGARVIGAKADKHRLPPLDLEVGEGTPFDSAGQSVQVIDVPGHTRGHIAFYLAEAGAVFTADSLMTLGCGRLFEGTAEEMWSSLSKLAALPPETLVYSGHEYTTTNAAFALTIEPRNEALQDRSRDIHTARAQNRPTVPVPLSLELATNPFLRAGLQSLKNDLSMPDAGDSDVFAEIRRRKDTF